MGKRPCVVLQLVAFSSLFLHSATVNAEAAPSGNLLGQRGVLRVGAATPQPAGWFGIGTHMQYFSASSFLTENDEHSRMVNSFFINWAPIRYVEAALGFHVTSDNSVSGPDEELQVAVGDPQISIKSGAELGHGISLGGLVDLHFPSAAGFFNASGSATSALFALLGSWTGGESLPLNVNLNLGFFLDGSENLFDDPEKMTRAQRYSALVSSFNRLVTRVGVEYETRYVGPFLEFSLEPFMGSGAPGFGKSPGALTVGAKIWPTKAKGLQLLACMDIGLLGVADGQPVVPQSTGMYAFAIPRWNLLLQMSYRFDPFAEPATTMSSGDVEHTPPSAQTEDRGAVRGVVLDAQTNKPIWNASITISDEEASRLAVNPADGTFQTYQITRGSRTLQATADGYAEQTVQVEILPDAVVQTTFKLSPKNEDTPGTLRGTIKALAGKRFRGATILIPQIDKKLQVGPDGAFSLSLKPGEYSVMVSARGFRTQTKTIRIQQGSTVILNVDLHR